MITPSTGSGRGGQRTGAGRPTRELKSHKVLVRFSPREVAQLNEIQAREGLRSRSATIRWLLEQDPASPEPR